MSLSKQIGEELHWWIQNFSFVNWEVLNFSPIATDNKFKGINLGLGRVSCQGQITGTPRFQEKTKSHINALELKASKLAIMIYMDSMVALSYLEKMGSKKNQELVTIIKEIYDYLLLHKITITAEYLPRVLNGEADRESRDLKDSRKWKLDSQAFKKICLTRFITDIESF